jgi:hypothetical protein
MGRSVGIGCAAPTTSSPGATDADRAPLRSHVCRTRGQVCRALLAVSAVLGAGRRSLSGMAERDRIGVSTGCGARRDVLRRSGSVTMTFMPPTAVLDALRDRGGIATVAELAAAAAQSSRAVRRQAARQGGGDPSRRWSGFPRTHPSTRDWICAAALHAAGRTGRSDSRSGRGHPSLGAVSHGRRGECTHTRRSGRACLARCQAPSAALGDPLIPCVVRPS